MRSAPHAQALLALPLLLALAGCSGGGSMRADRGAPSSGAAPASAYAKAEASALEGAAASIAIRTAPPIEAPRRIIYTGRVQLACENLERATESLLALVRKYDAYVGDAQSDGTKGTSRAGSWTVRVPSDRFDAFLGDLPGIGELESTQRQAQDVSAEYYDAESRVKNKRVEESRLVEILRRPNNNLDAILRVERELSRVREEIETTEGRLRFLAHQTDLSTVTISIREAKVFKPEGPPTVATRVSRTFQGSVDSLKETTVSLMLVVVAILPWAVPFLVFGLIAFLTARRLVRKGTASHRPPII